ncbi:hypothetical protein IMSHALPRED_002657 [Imshaugia aleurites]|uniref:Uncharacterized protein n=1 Tax=Imshaugia aleurites TaxID=172621 RepID=A0A8H3EZS0_9LECA|nr:hypothetical protein IMSHALPRED_002657 [Imshaugia aleurites]
MSSGTKRKAPTGSGDAGGDSSPPPLFKDRNESSESPSSQGPGTPPAEDQHSVNEGMKWVHCIVTSMTASKITVRWDSDYEEKPLPAPFDKNDTMNLTDNLHRVGERNVGLGTKVTLCFARPVSAIMTLGPRTVTVVGNAPANPFKYQHWDVSAT